MQLCDIEKLCPEIDKILFFQSGTELPLIQANTFKAI